MAIRKTVAAVLTTGMVLSMIPLTALAYVDGKAPDYVKDTWKQSGGKWYFYDESGKKIKNTWALIDTTDNDKCDGGYYHFDKNGVMEKNKWVYYFDTYNDYGDITAVEGWRYLGSDGKAVTGWKKISKKWYYFNTYGDYGNWHDTEYVADTYGYQDCIMATGVNVFDLDVVYYFNKDGVMQKNRWIKEKYYCDGDYDEGEEDWYYYYMYVGSDGAAYVGWHKIGGKWYYFAHHQQDCFACMMSDVLIGANGIYDDIPLYYVGKDGAMVTNKWMKFDRYELDIDCDDDDQVWAYFGKDGRICRSNWIKSGGKWYYFDEIGAMVCNTSMEIKGKVYNFDKNGVCLNP